MDLENFAKKYNLDLKVLEKEINEIMKVDKCSPQAALNEWKRKNFDKLAIAKKGKKITALYLFTESVPEFKRDDGTSNPPFFRVFFMALPSAEGEAPIIAFYKTAFDKIEEFLPEEPPAFSGFDFEQAYVTKGERLNWFRSVTDENDLPLLTKRDKVDIDNKELHEMFIHCAKGVEFWYDELQEREIEYRNNLFCYLQVTGVGEPFTWTAKTGEDAGKEFVCKTYFLADNVDETSLMRLVFRDWRSELPNFDKYDNVFFYGGYAKQNLENEDQLELGWSQWNSIYLARCPTPY